MIHPTFQVYLPQVTALFKKYEIKNAYAFGSVVTNRFNDTSDVDILVNFADYSDPLKVGQSIWDLQDELAQLTCKKIDLLTERSLKNQYFIQELKNTKELIYESSTQ